MFPSFFLKHSDEDTLCFCLEFPFSTNNSPIHFMNDQIDSPPPPSAPKKVHILRRIWRGIASVFRFVRVSVANILLVIVFIFVLSVIFSGPAITVEPGSVLVFTPNQSLVEKRPNTNPLFELLLGNTGADVTDVHDVVVTLRHAAKNPRILALEIRPDDLAGASLVHLDLIGEALEEFSASGKPIYAYSEDFYQSAYLLSSYADAIYLNSLGSVSFSGLAFESMYYKAVLDKLDITMHTFRSGDYKSAVEPFLLDSMSDIVRESYRPIVDQLWGSTKELIETNREISQATVTQFTEGFADLLDPNRKRLSELAVEYGFVDELLTSDALTATVSERFGLNALGKSTPRISTEDYHFTIRDNRDFRLATKSDQDQVSSTKQGGTVAVITVEGTIFGWPGDDSAQLVDSTGAVEHLQRAIKEEVDAVVLRVNSPGGSVVASEAIRLQVEAVKKQNIPIVVSMSNTAASGGYWISAGADHILASDSTITGSIGVFSMIPTVEELLERVGVSSDGVYSSDGHFRIDSAMGISETESKMLQASVDDAYDRFLDVVSDGRGIPKDEVDAIAGGRIWTGRQALEIGLVDELGNYDDAIKIAASLAGLKSFVVERYGFVRRPPFMNLIARASNWAPHISPESHRLIRQARGAWGEIIEHLSIEPRKIYALCEFCPDF